MDVSQEFKDSGFVFKEITEHQKNHPKYLLAKEICEKNEIYLDVRGKKWTKKSKQSKRPAKKLAKSLSH